MRARPSPGLRIAAGSLVVPALLLAYADLAGLVGAIHPGEASGTVETSDRLWLAGATVIGGAALLVALLGLLSVATGGRARPYVTAVAYAVGVVATVVAVGAWLAGFSS